MCIKHEVHRQSFQNLLPANRRNLGNPQKRKHIHEVYLPSVPTTSLVSLQPTCCPCLSLRSRHILPYLLLLNPQLRPGSIPTPWAWVCLTPCSLRREKTIWCFYCLLLLRGRRSVHYIYIDRVADCVSGLSVAPVCARRNTDPTAATGATPHTATAGCPICTKRFHRRHNGQPPLYSSPPAL